MAVSWPADRVERRAVDALIPYARNARTHSDEQVAQIAASIREWGWTVPVLVDEQACFGMELAPQYADVAVKRWQNFSGQSATLEGDGRTFADLEAERLGKQAA